MRNIRTIVLFSAITPFVLAQSGSFSNLNFELGRPNRNSLDPAIALPNWTIGGTDVPPVGEQKLFFYDTRALDQWAVSIHDSQSDSFMPIAGRYSVFLQSGRVMSIQPPGEIIYGSASISQTATVPTSANSLLFSSSQLFGPMELSLKGQILPYYKMEDRGSYSVYGADVSAFAGQMSELKFRTPWPSSVYLDDIQFSNQVIPEPTTLSLIASGLVLYLLGLRAKRA